MGTKWHHTRIRRRKNQYTWVKSTMDDPDKAQYRSKSHFRGTGYNLVLQNFKDTIGELTLNDINQAVQKHIDPNALATVIVGPGA